MRAAIDLSPANIQRMTKLGPNDLERKEYVRLLFTAYQESHSPTIESVLLQIHLGLAAMLARKYQNRGEPIEDLMQAAQAALLGAVRRFNPDSGAAFTSFAVPSIDGELKRHFRDRTWSIKVARGLKELYLKIGPKARELEEELGREPNFAELAEALEVTEGELLEAHRAGGNYKPGSLDATPENDQDVSKNNWLADSDEDQLALIENRMVLAEMISKLPERHQQIVKLSFFGGLNQRQIGERIGVSQVHVSRLLREALYLLQIEVGTSNPFQEIVPIEPEGDEMTVTETGDRPQMVTQEEAIELLGMNFPSGVMTPGSAFLIMRQRYGLPYGNNPDGTKHYNLERIMPAWIALLADERELAAVQPPGTIPAAPPSEPPDDPPEDLPEFTGKTVDRIAAYITHCGGRVEDPNGGVVAKIADALGITSSNVNQMLTYHSYRFDKEVRGKRTYAIWLIEKESEPAVPETLAPTPQASEEPVSATTAEPETSEEVEVVDADHVTNLELAIGNGHVEPTIAASLLTRQLARRSPTFDRLDDLTIAQITAELVASTMAEASAE